MSQIEILAENLKKSEPPGPGLRSVDDVIRHVRDLPNYKSIVFVLRNSDFAKLYLEKEFLANKEKQGLDIFLFSIILAFVDIEDLTYSKKLSRALYDYSPQHWTSLLAKTHLLYITLYDPHQAV